MKEKLKLGSIEHEAELCRRAFKGVKTGAFVLHCHHEILAETLTEDAENRIAYILSSKSRREMALRLHLFRPVSEVRLKKFKKVYADQEKAEAVWRKAEAERKKAYAVWRKAEAEWKKAYVDWQKAEAERKRTYAVWRKAYGDWEKAYYDLAILVHEKCCQPECPWDGKTIFPVIKFRGRP